MATISDKRILVNGVYEADVITASDYTPFGMPMVGRAYQSGDYRYGFTGKENDNEIKGTGNSIDFGDRVYDPRLGRWLSLDPLQAKYPYISPYNYALNSPLEKIDPNGKYAVSVHYRITYKAALKAGFSKEVAASIAHYASVYADHPEKHILYMDNYAHLRGHDYKSGKRAPNYNKTKDSQAESNSKWHTMMSDAEALNGMSRDAAFVRGMKFGWEGVLSQYEKLDFGVLGQGVHALEDGPAHEGANTSRHLGFSHLKTFVSAVKMTWNDMVGNTDQADRLSESAMKVFAIITNKAKGNLEGKNLYLKGMTIDQLNKFKGILDKKGYTIDFTKDLDSSESFDNYIIRKKKN